MTKQNLFSISAAAFALTLAAACTTAQSTARYRRSMDDDRDVAGRAPASVPANGAAAQGSAPAKQEPGPLLAAYACQSADAKTKFTLTLHQNEGTIQLEGGGQGYLVDAQPGEVKVAEDRDVLAVDGIGDENNLYYVALSQFKEFPPKTSVQLITIRSGAQQPPIETTCSKN